MDNPGNDNNEKRYWVPYDPTWLVELANKQCMKDEPWLPAALAKCTKAVIESEAYIIFYAPNSKPTDKFETTIELFTENDSLVLDIYEGNRVGGVEFLSKIDDTPDYNYHNTPSRNDDNKGVYTSPFPKTKYDYILGFAMLAFITLFVLFWIYITKHIPLYISLGFLLFLGIVGMVVTQLTNIIYLSLVAISLLVAFFLREKTVYFIAAPALIVGFSWGAVFWGGLDSCLRKNK